MKKIAFLLLLVLTLAGCGKKTHLFTIDNQSDWRVVVSITNEKNLVKKLINRCIQYLKVTILIVNRRFQTYHLVI